ncbi:MAG: adenine phosphoribosyltransferase [Thermoanaerobaculia bacterium]
MELEKFIRDIPDFPKPGIIFKDITPLLAEPEAFIYSLEIMEKDLKKYNVHKILAIESRGFIFGAALAARNRIGFVPVRKPGKLPYTTIRESYELEYGKNILEMHHDAIKPGERVAIVDDLLATGGTAQAVIRMAKKLGAEIGCLLFLVELDFLEGRKKLEGYPLHTYIHFKE